MRRLPILATIVVLAAVATMIALGLWQRSRAAEKEALIARVAANASAPLLPLTPGTPLERNLLRKVAFDCAAAGPARVAGAGKYGFRLIADCRVAGRSEPLGVQLGTRRRPMGEVRWSGGPVTGYLAPAPDPRSLLRQLVDRRPGGVLVVAEPALAGLAANPRPDLADIPNNHRSYMVQWFAFAAIALLVYAIALRARWGRR